MKNFYNVIVRYYAYPFSHSCFNQNTDTIGGNDNPSEHLPCFLQMSDIRIY